MEIGFWCECVHIIGGYWKWWAAGLQKFSVFCDLPKMCNVFLARCRGTDEETGQITPLPYHPNVFREKLDTLISRSQHQLLKSQESHLEPENFWRCSAKKVAQFSPPSFTPYRFIPYPQTRRTLNATFISISSSSSKSWWLFRYAGAAFTAAKVQWKSSWWLNQPVWKIWVKLDHFPKDPGWT